MTTKKFKSGLHESMYSAAKALTKVGTMDKATLREFDEACFVKIPELKAGQIKRIRERNIVSQPVFARYLNTSESTIQKWEAGTKKPSGMALKLLDVVDKHGLSVLG